MVQRISATDFARLFSMRAATMAWFVGAGGSVSAGIPTAQTMIMDFKVRLFCAATNLSRRDIDSGDPLWVERINNHFDGAYGFPRLCDPTQDAVAFGAAYPDARARRAYIEEAVRKGVPSFGHRVLAALISSRLMPCVFTTNFDPLIERVTVITDQLLPASAQVHMTVAALDSAERAERCLRDSAWPMMGKLHGDYQSDRLKNVPSELQAQDGQMRRVLIECCRRFGLLVGGYSGRDESVMEALVEAVAPNSFPSGLFWVARPGREPTASVFKFLESAVAAGIDARIVEAANFDELCGEM